MVQIREYTQREGLQPVNRGGLNIQKPRAFAEGVGTTISKKPLETMSELAKLGVAMKERRDDAMVSEFINQHSIEATQQINDLQQKYKGLNAHKVLDKYNQWNEEYVAKYSSYDNASDDDDEHVYLENAEQLKKAKEMLSRSHVSTLNSLSNYVGREEETARQNALSATIQSEVERIAQTDIPENIEISKQNIIANLSALYRGQSGEFINQKAKNLTDTAIASNLMRVASNNPEEAIALYSLPIYQNNMDDKTKREAKKNLQKMYQTQVSNNIADELTKASIENEQPINASEQEARISVEMDKILSNDFFNDVNKAEYKNKIKKDAIDKATKATKDLIEANATVQNDALLQLSAVENVDGEWQVNGIDPENMATIASTYKGMKTYDLINSIAKQSASEDYLLQNGFDLPAPTQEQDNAYHNALSKLEGGYYKVAGDMSEDISGLPVSMQKDILSRFMSDYSYKKQAKELKTRTNIDAEKKLKESYKMVSGLDSSKYPTAYNSFKKDTMRSISAKLAAGETLSEDIINKAATDVWGAMYESNNSPVVASRMIQDTARYISENTPRGTTVSYEYRLNAAKDVLDKESFGYNIGEGMRDALARYIVEGDVDMIVNTLDIAMRSEASRIEREKQEQKEFWAPIFSMDISESGE